MASPQTEALDQEESSLQVEQHELSATNADEPQPPSLAHDLFTLLLKIALVLVSALVVFSFVFGLSRVSDPSMEPTFQDGDLIMFYRLDRNFVAQDVVMLEYEGTMYAGRIVAVEGDTVDIDSRGLIVNGNYQQEENIYRETTQVADGVTFPLTVPEGEVFLLGDNRTRALDSRIYGCVPTENIFGKVMGLFRRRNF